MGLEARKPGTKHWHPACPVHWWKVEVRATREERNSPALIVAEPSRLIPLEGPTVITAVLRLLWIHSTSEV